MYESDPLSKSLIEAAAGVGRVDEAVDFGNLRDPSKKGGSVDLAGTDLEKIIKSAFKRQAAHLEMAFVSGGKSGSSSIAVTMLRVEMAEVMKAAKALKTTDVSIGAQTQKGKKINGGITILFSGIK